MLILLSLWLTPVTGDLGLTKTKQLLNNLFLKRDTKFYTPMAQITQRLSTVHLCICLRI